MSGRSRSRGRSSSPRGASASSPVALSSDSVLFLEKGKENNRVQYLVSVAGAEPEWILRTELIDLGHKPAMLRWEREQKTSGSSASSSRKKSASRGRSASRSRSKSRSASTKKARGASPSPKRGRSKTPTRRAVAAGGSSVKKARSPSKRSASPKRASTPKAASKSAAKSAKKAPSSTPPRSSKKSAGKAPPKTATPARRSRSVSRKTPTPQKAPKSAKAKDFAAGMRAVNMDAHSTAAASPFSTFVLPEDAFLGSAQLVASAKQLISAPLRMALLVLGGVALLHVDNEYIPAFVASQWQAAKAAVVPLPWFELVVFLVVIGVLQGLRRHQAAVVHSEYTRLTVLATLVLGVVFSSFSVGLPPMLTSWAALGVALALFVANRILLVARTTDDNSYMPKKTFAPLHIEGAALVAMAVAVSACSQVPGLSSLTKWSAPESMSQVVAMAAPLAALAALGNAVTALFLAPTSRGIARVAGVVAVCVVLSTCNVCAMHYVRDVQQLLGSVYIKSLMDASVRLPSQWLVAAGVWLLGYSCKA